MIDRDVARGAVKVLLQESEAMPSAWLPVVTARAKGDGSFWLPELDELVACAVDENAEFGVVLGAIYSSANPPSADDVGEAVAFVRFGDGTLISYDRQTHKLSVYQIAEGAAIEISTVGDVIVSVPDGKSVFVGSAEDGQQLATKAFVTDVHAQHVHPTPAGLSGVPIGIPGQDAWPHVTERAIGR